MKVLATYQGRRMTTKNNLAYSWLFFSVEGATSQLYDKQLAPAVIGEKFELTTNDTGAVFTKGKDAPRTVSTVLDDRHIEWSALDTIAKEEYDNNKAMKRLDKMNTQFERRLAPLKEMFDSLTFNDDRAAFVNKVTKELWRRS